MPTLYQTEWCAWSHRVRQVMTELCVTYTCVNVPPSREGRKRLLEVSGQDQIPVLVDDDDEVIVGSDSIIEHLRRRHERTPYSDRQAAAGRFRTVRALDLAQEDALARLRALLAENRLEVVSEVRLPIDDETGYVLLQAAHEPSARRLGAKDPATVGALTVQIGVWPTAGGCHVSVADPVGGAWIAGLPYTIKTNRQLRERVKRVLETLA